MRFQSQVPRTIMHLTSVILTFFARAEARRWYGPANRPAAPASRRNSRRFIAGPPVSDSRWDIGVPATEDTHALGRAWPAATAAWRSGWSARTWRGLAGASYFARMATKSSEATSPTLRLNLISSPEILPL